MLQIVSDSNRWKEVMATEMKSFEENERLTLAEMPEGGAVVDCK